MTNFKTIAGGAAAFMMSCLMFLAALQPVSINKPVQIQTAHLASAADTAARS
jgi:hypothetical protein